MASRGRATRLVVCLVLVLVAPGCSAGRETTSTTSMPPATRRVLPIDFSKPGPYKVGVAEVAIDRPSGDVTSAARSLQPRGAEAPPSRSGAVSPEPVPVPADGSTGEAVASRRAAVFYPADAGNPGQYPVIAGYSTASAFPEAVRGSLPPEMVDSVRVDLLDSPPPNREMPFPVVIFSHDRGSFNWFAARHFEHLASWGFVVAAPDHQERALAAEFVPVASPTEVADQDITDMRSTSRALNMANLEPGGKLQGTMNLDLVAVEGHGSGGRTAFRVAVEQPVKAIIGLATDVPVSTPAGAEPYGTGPPDRTREALASADLPSQPTLLIASDQDSINQLPNEQVVYEWLSGRPSSRAQPSPSAIAVLSNAGHNASLDLCAPIWARGGLSQFSSRQPALAGYFARAEDGCRPDNLDPSRSYALIDHLCVAYLRWAFGIDGATESMDVEFLERTFPGTIEGFSSRA